MMSYARNIHKTGFGNTKKGPRRTVPWPIAKMVLASEDCVLGTTIIEKRLFCQEGLYPLWWHASSIKLSYAHDMLYIAG